MPGRKSGASKKGAPVARKSHKRQLSETASGPTTPASRASKRIKESVDKERRTGKATPTKSKYFQELDSEDDDVDDVADDESGYDDEDVAAPEEPSSDDSVDEDEDEDDSEEEVKKRKTKGKKATKGAGGLGAVVNAVMEKGKELWRPGVKTGLGPGKQVFIEKPKPRGDGGIKYLPGTIHPNTMAFLKDLKANNDREWLKSKRLAKCLTSDCHAAHHAIQCLVNAADDTLVLTTGCTVHDPDYRQSWKDWESFVEALTEKITEIDDTVPELPPKDLVCSTILSSWFSGRTNDLDHRSSGSTAISGSLLTLHHTRYVAPQQSFQALRTLLTPFASHIFRRHGEYTRHFAQTAF
jgi:hypothetical protein